MKEKVQSFAPVVATTVMGILLVLFGIGMFGNGTPGAWIFLGIMSLLIGLAYVFVFVMGMLKRDGGSMELVASAILLMGYPLFMLIYFIIRATGGILNDATDWIIFILVWLFSAGTIVLSAVVTFAPKMAAKFDRLRIMCTCGLLASVILVFVFVAGGTLGQIPLFDVAIFAAYALIAFSAKSGSAPAEESESKSQDEEA